MAIKISFILAAYVVVVAVSVLLQNIFDIHGYGVFVMNSVFGGAVGGLGLSLLAAR